jgi:transcriptional regulator with XRE-family HTH domain
MLVFLLHKFFHFSLISHKSQPEYDIIQAMIDARLQQNLTQKDLSARTGITQADISRIENGTRNPSLSMVKKLAHGLGLQLKLEFIQTPAK